MAIISGTDDANILAGTGQGDSIFAFGGDDIITLTTGADSIDGGEGNDLLRGVLATAQFGSTVTYTITSTRIFGSLGGVDTTFSGIERLQLSESKSAAIATIIDASTASGAALRISGGPNTQITGSAGDDFIGVTARIGVFSSINAGAGNDQAQVSLDQGSFLAKDTADGIVIIDNSSGNVLTTITNAEEYIIAPVIYPNQTFLFFDGSAVSRNLQIRASGTYNLVMGGSGADRIIISGPDSNLWGNAGADSFLVSNMTQGGHVAIADFSTDDILSIGTQNGIVSQFIGKSAFSGVAGEYRYTVSDFQTVIEMDRNGDGQADVTIDFGGSAFIPLETETGSNILTKGIIPGLLVGDGDDDTLTGTDQNDLIHGNDGDDVITGGKGNDILIGGEGADSLRGGAGADAFVFIADGSIEDRDRILDFGNEDIVVVKTKIFDANGDGIITFGQNRVLDLQDGNSVAISANGKAVRSLEYDGFYDMGDERFYIYSKVGSDAGIDTFATMSLAEYLI